MRELYEIADFVRSMRRRLRFGELSRAPLRILRLEVRDERAWCDWLARPPDEFDSSLPPSLRAEASSRQALSDAIAMRSMLLDQLPSIRSACVRAFRAAPPGSHEPIIVGTITREDAYLLRTPSPVMRAKLCGYRFELENGFLKRMEADEHGAD